MIEFIILSYRHKGKYLNIGKTKKKYCIREKQIISNNYKILKIILKKINYKMYEILLVYKKIIFIKINRIDYNYNQFFINNKEFEINSYLIIIIN